ncbi:hypothetical protein TNCT_685661 [Trichonephila clavata]|uniref:Uncharacterized protein n=1 Tax=Trichonephila clavata TaxID=2740835 RepID=A0A8X6KD71_TRICU|nr:hypothetical protein TNCT_685661 [Trichonephila clavata]
MILLKLDVRFDNLTFISGAASSLLRYLVFVATYFENPASHKQVVADDNRIRIACFAKFGYSSNTSDQNIVNETVLNWASYCVSELNSIKFS